MLPHLTLRRAGRLIVVVVAAFSSCTAEAIDPAPHIEDLPVLTLAEELRIGSLEDPEVGFTDIGSVWVSPTGEVYVSEQSENEIRKYGPDGQLLRTYGREGDGPGEFRSVGWFGVVGDTLWVSDGALHRTTLFDADGSVAATVTALIEVPVRGEDFGGPITVSVFPNALRPDGLIESIFVPAIRANLPDSVVQVPRVLFDRSGNVVDTLEMVRALVSRPARVIEFGNRTSFVYIDPPAYDSGTYQLDLEPGAFSVHWAVQGNPARGSLLAVRRNEDGDTTRTETLEYTPRAVTDRYRDSLAASRVRGRLSRGDSLQLLDAYKSAQQLPPHHEPIWPPFLVGEAGREGTLWAKLDPDDPGANRWLVFRQDGEPWGTLSLPLGDFPRWSGGDDLWITERDEFDVPWLVRYRVIAAGG